MVTVTICSDFGAQEIKSDTVSTVSPPISHEVMGQDACSMYLMKTKITYKWTHTIQTCDFQGFTIISLKKYFCRQCFCPCKILT